MALEDYIGPSETIQVVFGIAVRYFVIQVLVIVLIFGGLGWIYRETPFFLIPVVVLGSLVLLYTTLFFFSIRYFVTEKKLYKREGILWKKVSAVKADEVENVTIVQGFLERLIGIGALDVGTSGLPGEETIMLRRIADPAEKKRAIYTAWGM